MIYYIFRLSIYLPKYTNLHCTIYTDISDMYNSSSFTTGIIQVHLHPQTRLKETPSFRHSKTSLMSVGAKRLCLFCQ